MIVSGVILENDGQRIGARHPAQHGLHRSAVAQAVADEFGQELGHDFRIGLRGEGCAVGDQFVLELGKILDDAVVNDGNAIGEMRMGIGFGRRAMGRPAGVGNADRAGQRLAAQLYSRLTSLPSARRRSSTPSWIVATPAES